MRFFLRPVPVRGRDPVLPALLAMTMTVGLLLAPLVNAGEAQQQAKELLQQSYERYGGEPQARERTAELAEKKSGTCRLCHGSDGNSVKPDFPSLAGERPIYLLRRLMQLKQGVNESKTCSRGTRRLSSEQMVALALHFSALHRYPLSVDEDLAARGKSLYEQICRECHLPDGLGLPGMPVIAGQQPGYLAKTLVHFRDHPGWRHSEEMPAKARSLDPDQFSALAEYAASLNH